MKKYCYSGQHEVLAALVEAVSEDLGWLRENDPDLCSLVIREGENTELSSVDSGIVLLLAPADVTRAEIAKQLAHAAELLAKRTEILSCGKFIASSQATFEIVRKIERYKNLSESVLLLGESGTGKELLAEALGTPGKPFVAINCAQFSQEESRLEAELFGHEKGAFTGALSEHRGLFERAQGGVVFLDELHCLSTPSQQKLLRVLEERKVRRIGGSREIPLSFRLVCASKPDIAERVAAGSFLPDLLYRVNALTLTVPPLRERPEEIVPLARAFALPSKRFSAGAFDELRKYSWPGNVRELKNVITRLSYQAIGGSVTALAVSEELFNIEKSSAQTFEFDHALFLEKKEKEYFRELFRRFPLKEMAMKVSGLSRATFYRRYSQLMDESSSKAP